VAPSGNNFHDGGDHTMDGAIQWSVRIRSGTLVGGLGAEKVVASSSGTCFGLGEVRETLLCMWRYMSLAYKMMVISP
jgi:hypothetical protein